MNVLLLAAPVHQSGDNEGMRLMPPPSIYYLAAIIRENGFRVKVLDPALIRAVNPIEEIEMGLGNLLDTYLEDTDVVAISTNTTNWGVARFIAQVIYNKTPDIPIIVGGVHAYYFSRHILTHSFASYVIRGEGEKSLIDLLIAINNRHGFSKVQGLAYKKDNEVIVNPLNRWLEPEEIKNSPLPAYEMVPENYYSVMPIETSRGCKYSCAFCSVPRRNNWCGLDADWIAQRVITASKKHGAKFSKRMIYLVDDCFTADKERAKKILNRFDKYGLQSRLIIEARVTDLLESNLIESIPKDIIARLAIGVECGYDEGLRRIGKGLSVEQVEKCLDILSERNLLDRVYMSFIIGFPWETEQECLKTIHFASFLVNKYNINVNVNWLYLYPSRLWAKRKTYGISLNESVFDDPSYMWNQKYFYETHPSIKKATKIRVDDVIKAYLDNGYNIKSG